MQDAVALDRLDIALGQQSGQLPPALPRRGIDDDVGSAIDKDQSGADNQAQVGFAACFLFGRQAFGFAPRLLVLQQPSARLFRRIT